MHAKAVNHRQSGLKIFRKKRTSALKWLQLENERDIVMDPTAKMQNFCFLSKWLGCFAQKQPYLPPNMHSLAHLGLAGSFGALLLGVWGARAALSIEHLPTLFSLERVVGLLYRNYLVGNEKGEDNGRTWVGNEILGPNKSQRFEVKVKFCKNSL